MYVILKYNFNIKIGLLQLDEEHPVSLDLREETNTQWDFLAFIIYLLEENFLSTGDILILDNAKVQFIDYLYYF